MILSQSVRTCNHINRKEICRKDTVMSYIVIDSSSGKGYNVDVRQTNRVTL